MTSKATSFTSETDSTTDSVTSEQVDDEIKGKCFVLNRIEKLIKKIDPFPSFTEEFH